MLEEVVNEDMEADQMVLDENLRTVTRVQGGLYDEEKWTVPFRAPPIYYDLFGHENVKELSEFADISRGISSGANPFFYKRTTEWEELGLEEYTTPLLKASGQVSRIRCTEADAGEWGVLDLYDTVQPALEDARERYEDVDKEEYVKDWLEDEDHGVLVEYINSGEESGYHERPTMNSRTLWFNLGDLTHPPMFIPDFTWRVHRVLWGEGDIVSDRQFYHIVPDDDIDGELLCAILNSRFVWLMCELRGRWSQGQRLSRSEIKVYETKELPVPNPRLVSEEERDGIVEAFYDLMEQEDRLDEDDRTVENTMEKRDRLDREILSAFGMEDRLEELKNAIDQMIAMREKEAGEKTEVLVSRKKEREVIDLEGVESARESTTLGDFH